MPPASRYFTSRASNHAVISAAVSSASPITGIAPAWSSNFFWCAVNASSAAVALVEPILLLFLLRARVLQLRAVLVERCGRSLRGRSILVPSVCVADSAYFLPAEMS